MPVGVPAPPVTVAVNVTDVPKADGLTEEDRVVVLPLAYRLGQDRRGAADKIDVAAIHGRDGMAAERERAATLPASEPEPIVPPPSLKVTVPVAVPLGTVMVAVKVTVAPTALGLIDDVTCVLLVA